MLADHGDSAVVRDAGVHDDPLADLEAVDAFAEGRDHACAVGTEDSWLRNGGEAFPHPHVEMVQRAAARSDTRTSPGPATGSSTSS